MSKFQLPADADDIREMPKDFYPEIGVEIFDGRQIRVCRHSIMGVSLELGYVLDGADLSVRDEALRQTIWQQCELIRLGGLSQCPK